MMALFIAASGGIVVGLAVGGLFSWVSRADFKARIIENPQDIDHFSPYRPIRK